MEEKKPRYKLEVFEGPLDLLLSLISKNEIDIHDIPIAEIFRQYTEYIDFLRSADMDVASEFIVMASELMLIKSRMLLPGIKEDGGEDPREELVNMLLEYKRAKEEAAYLSQRFSRYSGRFAKETDEVGIDRSYVGDQQAEYLIKAFSRLLERIELDRKMQNDDAAVSLQRIITERPSSVSEKASGIMARLRKEKSLRFMDVMLQSRTRSDIIASFMAILQLISSQKIISIYGDDDCNPVLRVADDTDVQNRNTDGNLSANRAVFVPDDDGQYDAEVSQEKI